MLAGQASWSEGVPSASRGAFSAEGRSLVLWLAPSEAGHRRQIAQTNGRQKSRTCKQTRIF
jgi:hypothetical protein